MKSVVYSNQIQKTKKLRQLAEQGTHVLDDILGNSARLVDAEWNCIENGNGRNEITLQISDWTGSASAQFAPAEFEQGDVLRRRLNWLWGDLLQIRNHWQLQQFETSGR